MLRTLLRLLGICDHPHRYRERDRDGRLTLICERCGDPVLAIQRTARDTALMKAGEKFGVSRAQVMPKRRRANVTPITNGRQAR